MFDIISERRKIEKRSGDEERAYRAASSRRARQFDACRRSLGDSVSARIEHRADPTLRKSTPREAGCNPPIGIAPPRATTLAAPQ